MLEVCVDSTDGLAAACEGGADRIELCSALGLGGLTPGQGLMSAGAACGVPCHAMVRPRPGDFVLRPGDLTAMLIDIQSARQAGLAGVVIGVAHTDGSLDIPALNQLKQAAQGLQTTLHRVFDLTPHPLDALQAAIELGLTRILTSGQASSAINGQAMLKHLCDVAQGRIDIMAGGGVRADQARALLATGVQALHASCSQTDPTAVDVAAIGIAPRRVTQVSQVAALKAAMMSKAA